MCTTVLNNPVLEFDPGNATPAAPRPRRLPLRKINLWLFLGGLVYCIVRMASCSAYLATAAGADLQDAVNTVNAFLDAGARNDPVAAVAMVSQQQAADGKMLTDIATLFRDKPEFFQDRASTDLLSWKATWSTQGNRMELGGRITYSDGTLRDYSATLAKEGEAWRLLGIWFTTREGSLARE